ncbi:lysylphosphatidylglycerol synthase domain-containing protein [Paramylibacter ulvae]|uniref:lysylphosphatidylglycerol synthase domain-containing protein n=1 Tax=Paramylibacter ulvae TaxID=1651968 RepID=UPI001E4E2532|nr:lysylphosphatidylglycerol synthase domain-containing protein [Amylibacter ulvae]
MIKFYDHWELISKWEMNSQEYFLLFLLSVLYGTTLFILAISWFVLLQNVENNKIAIKPAIGIYARAQIAKYLPGNIFHLIGRHFYLQHFNFAHSAVLKTSLLEALLMLGCAFLTSLLFWNTVLIPQVDLSPSIVLGILGAVVAGTHGTVFFQLNGPFANKLKTWVIALFLCSLFFLLQGCIFMLSSLILNWEISSFLIFVTAISWAIGFVLPGAPGGLGVREFIMFFLLNGIFPETEILILLAMFRLITILGDVSFFLMGLIFNATPEK